MTGEGKAEVVSHWVTVFVIRQVRAGRRQEKVKCLRGWDEWKGVLADGDGRATVGSSNDRQVEGIYHEDFFHQGEFVLEACQELLQRPVFNGSNARGVMNVQRWV